MLLYPDLHALHILGLSENSLSAAVAEESGEVPDAGADVDEAVAVVGRAGSDGGGDRDKFGRKPQIKAALKKAAGFCRGSA